MPASRSTRVCRSTSAILTVPGNAAPTRTPMGCCANTFLKAPTSACTTPRRLPPWRRPSTLGRERHWLGKHLQRRLTGCSDWTTNSLLRRPLESAQYTSLAFGGRCREAGVRPSMGSVGDAYDNAMCESFFSTLECELLERRRFSSQAEAKMACFSYIEGFYNPVRLHSAIGYQSPICYESKTAQEFAVTP